MRVRTHGDFLDLREGVQVNDGDGRVVTVNQVSAGVDDVEFVAKDTEFVRLVSDLHFTGDLQGGRIDLKDRT